MSVKSICLLGFLAWPMACCLHAQQRDLTSLSLEDFLNVEVTSVSKTPQKLSRTAAAVYVITQDEIRRSGAVSLPDALRLAPGVHVARITGTTWAVGIRGFNGIYSNKLLVMIDGRTVYNALLSGTLWNDQLLMLEDVERIEVIRGPGGTMWGANAVSGVINIITKSTKNTQGGIASLSGGNFDPAKASVRYGGKLGETSTWRAWSQYSLQGQASFPGLNIGLDKWPAVRGGLRFDWDATPRDSVLIEGEVEKNSAQVVSISDHGEAAKNDSKSSVAFLMGRWNHKTDGGEAAFQAYYNESRLDSGFFSAKVRTTDLDFHYSHQLTTRHRVMAGGGMRADSIATSGSPGFYFQPANRTYYTYNAFLQDEWEIVPDKLMATIGAKVEHYMLAGMTYQPTARLMWTPTSKVGVWASVSQAIRAPAHTDYASHISTPLGVLSGAQVVLRLNGSEQFRPEVLKSLETGTRWMIGKKWGVDVAVFRHWYNGLQIQEINLSELTITPIPGSVIPLVVVPAYAANGMNGVNQGGEISTHFDVRPGLQLAGSYSSLFSQTYFRPGIDPAKAYSIPSYYPKHQWQVRADWEFGRNWTSELAFYRIGALAPHALPGYSRLDFRIARKLGKSAELSLSGQNLLRPRQQEFAGNLILPSGAVSRSVEIGVRWNFK
jgi:iron complex outermembrane receptor protein